MLQKLGGREILRTRKDERARGKKLGFRWGGDGVPTGRRVKTFARVKKKRH